MVHHLLIDALVVVGCNTSLKPNVHVVGTPVVAARGLGLGPAEVVMAVFKETTLDTWVCIHAVSFVLVTRVGGTLSETGAFVEAHRVVLVKSEDRLRVRNACYSETYFFGFTVHEFYLKFVKLFELIVSFREEGVGSYVVSSWFF